MSTVDEVLDSWEEMEESGALDKKLNSLQLNTLDNMEDGQSPNLTPGKNPPARMIILGEDGMRSQYVPPMPTVKILKRPQRDSQGSGDGPLTNGDKPKQPIKSLKQREQEYAEARKRILGEERSPEEMLDQEIQQNKIQPKQGANAVVGNSGNLPTNVVRMPSGPDGSRGFNVRR